ncbi:amidase signature enzyme [Coniochaeta ligniaria NRRL 30616]|uniref:Amidase signature enzyme n=1 Tax=Coniochaeta ligniaria NRRL 30616 TaxID=1408157 RepID=A0A1J7JQB0_9PEZI|nr:amidase signature enzyme [Coniochaeta ligniaria NRRL 30616]
MEECDVYQKRYFLEGMILTNVQRGQTLAADFYDYLRARGNKWLDVRDEKDLGEQLAPGPYLYYNKTLKPICRLYDDKQRTFLTALKPQLVWRRHAKFSQLKAGGTSYDCLAVAVPARSPENVNGARRRLRVAVKDLYAVKGLKTSLNNLSYYGISKNAYSSAAVVDSLARDGAHILGLTKLSSMIAREEPMDAVDFHTAFNPRGDGYQSPAGSSSGSAAAVASYDWLDCALGTDTSGSGRRPAMVNGVWEFRPSHDLVNLSGMTLTYPRFDTPCVFSREFKHLGTVARSWIPAGPVARATDQLYEVIYLNDYLPVDNPAQMKLIDGFVDDMRIHLGAVVTKLSIRQAWKDRHPAGLPESIDDYLKDVITQTYYHVFYDSTVDFREDAEDHGGTPPYVIPFVQRRWDKGAAVTRAQYEEATTKMSVYEDWLLDTLFLGRRTQALVILPVGNATPNYRDTPSPSPEDQSALDELFLQPILGSPDVVVPIGDVPYISRITHKVEYLPVVANVVGAPGTDFQLLQAVENVLKLAKRPTSVATGPRMFP